MSDSADLDDTTTDAVDKEHAKLYSQSTIVVPNDANNATPTTVDTSDTSPDSMDGHFFALFSKFDSMISDYITDDKLIVPVIQGLLNLSATVQRADLWSANESFDDVQTDYIKFALLPSMLAKLHSNLNPPHRVKWLQTSNFYASVFLNTCDKWNLLSKMDQTTFYKMKSSRRNDSKASQDDAKDGNDSKDASSSRSREALFKSSGDGKIVLHPKAQEMCHERDALIARHKQDQQAKLQMDALLADARSKHAKPPGQENKWKLFKDDETEREYWLLKLQVAVREALRLIKINTEELPLAQMMEKHAQQRKHQVLAKYDSLASGQKFEQWEPRESMQQKGDEMGAKGGQMRRGGGKMNIQVIDKSGRVEKFESVNALKYGMQSRIEDKIEQRLNSRDLVFKESNPWTYTPEQAAELGLFGDIPKDFFEKQKEQKRAQLAAKIEARRSAPNWEVMTNLDDGSQLEVGKVESKEIGGVTTINERDMPKEEQRHEDDMDDYEYDFHIRDKRAWDNWKDDNARGSGNPYLRG